MVNPSLPNIQDLDSEQLLALRTAIDTRLDEMKREITAQAERLGLAVTNGKERKKRGRKPKDETHE